MFSVKCGKGPLTLRKWILKELLHAAEIPDDPRWFSARLLPPSSQEPQHGCTPMLGLFAFSIAFLGNRQSWKRVSAGCPPAPVAASRQDAHRCAYPLLA